MEELSERCDGAAAATARVKAGLRTTEKEMERLTLTMKHAATYRRLRPMYDQYRQSRDKEKFLRGHEGEIILFEAAARELKRLDRRTLPATQRLRAEMDELTARKAALQSEYRKAQREEREYDTLARMWRPCWKNRGRPNHRGSGATSWNSGGCAPLPDFSKAPGRGLILSV